MNCLIGYTGFVGGNLAAQRTFDVLINSKNFETMRGQCYDRVICAGVSAVKWQANKDPEADLARIRPLMDVLATVTAGKFVLISTIDVYSAASGADESTDCHNPGHHAYGRHRLAFEDFCPSSASVSPPFQKSNNRTVRTIEQFSKSSRRARRSRFPRSARRCSISSATAS